MSADQPVTIDQVRASQWRTGKVLTMSDRTITNLHCIDFPRLVMSVVKPRREASRVRASRTYYVGAGQFAELADAVAAMNATEGGHAVLL